MFWWLAAAAALLLVSRAAAQGGHPLRQTVISAACGAGALGAVNLLAPVTGVSIALNWTTAFMAVVLGAPGVITLLILRLLIGT